MTVRDREVLDLLREEPELLAIADAVASTQKAPRRSPSWRRAAAGVAIAAVALSAVVLFWPGEGQNKGGVLDRALAAVPGRGPVLHMIFTNRGGALFADAKPALQLNLETGDVRVIEDETEVWYDHDRGLQRWVIRRYGHVVEDQTWRGGSGGQTQPPDPFEEAFDYRDALAKRDATVVGRGTWRGHPVYWLKFFGNSRSRYGIDRDSYRLLVIRRVDDRGRPTGFETALVRLEYLPRSEGQFGEPAPPTLGTQSGGPAYDPEGVPLSAARNSLGVPALWAGGRVAGFPFRRALPGDESRPPSSERCAAAESCADLNLVYLSGKVDAFGGAGAAFKGVPGFQIYERRRTAGSPKSTGFPPDWVAPPAGFATLTSLRLGLHTVWFADVAGEEINVRITASSRKLAIAAARALRPIPPEAR